VPTPAAPIRAVFLDRDDTLIRCTGIAPDGDLGDPDLVQPLPHAVEACKLLSEKEFCLVVVTNQGGVARGKYTPDTVHQVNERVNEVLAGTIDAFRYCPWHPEGSDPRWTREHPWRKPAPGMLLDAAAHLSIDLPASWMVGDALRDCQAGRAAGCRTILVPCSATATGALLQDPAVDFVAADLAEAAQIILREPAR
jgi:D-glycero-D-manno-heptose 1,7-bisphosphate phosphatase